MPLTIDEQLRLELQRTAYHKLARILPVTEQRQRAVGIIEWAERLRELAEGRYLHERQQRVDAEQSRLVDAAASRERHLVPRGVAADRFDPSRTRKQAETIVERQHEEFLARIDRMEADRLRPLVNEEGGRLRPGLSGVFELNARPGPVRSRKGPSRD